MPDVNLALQSPDRTEYADAVGFIRVKEKRDLLTTSRLQEFLSLDSRGILDKLHQMAGRESPGEGAPLETLLGSLLRNEYRAVEHQDHRGLVVPLLRYRYDVFHLRSLLRARLNGQAFVSSPVPGNHDPARLEEHLFQGRPLSLPPALGQALDIIPRQPDGAPLDDRIDLLLDLAWVRLGLEFTAARRLPLLTHYFQCLEDFTTLKCLWRRIAAQRARFTSHPVPLRVHYLDQAVLGAHDAERVADRVSRSVYGPALKEGLTAWRERGSWTLLDRDLDNFLVGELTAARYLPLGPEPLFGYLVARENDLKNIRIISVLKDAGWADGEIRRQLRRLYV